MGNNETIEICMNDEIIEENVSVQIKTSQNLKNEKKEEIKINLKKLQVQRKSWQPHLSICLCWSFYCVNDNIEIDLDDNTQIMCCIFCYQELVIGINSRTQARKGLISYYKKNGITSLKKHVHA
jgi:hypothetical protein